MTAAPNRGGGASGLWGVCEQSRSRRGAWPPPTAHRVPPGWPGAPPAGQRVHYTGAPTARGRGVSPAADGQTRPSHCNTHITLCFLLRHTRRISITIMEDKHPCRQEQSLPHCDTESTLILKASFAQLFMCFFFFFRCSSFDPRVRDALAVYTDDWLVIQRK